MLFAKTEGSFVPEDIEVAVEFVGKSHPINKRLVWANDTLPSHPERKRTAIARTRFCTY